MRRVGLVVAVAIFAISWPTPGAAETHPGGVLYLTAEAEPQEAGETCTDPARYAMGVSPIEESTAQPSFLTAPRGSCPTWFSYRATSSFDLGAEANVSLWLRCQPASSDVSVVPAQGTLQLLLTDDMAQQDSVQQGGHPDVVTHDAGAVACNGERFDVRATVPTDFRTLRPGDTLSLVVWLRFVATMTDAAPLVEFVVGGDDASRIEEPNLPSAADEGGDLAEEARPLLHWTTTLLTPTIPVDPPCLRPDPRYLMAEGADDQTLGRVAAEPGLPGVLACPIEFAFKAARPLAIDGRATVQFWYSCDEPILVSYFQAWLRTGEPLDQPTDHEFVQHGLATDAAPCPTEPTPVVFDFNVHPAIRVPAGDWLAFAIGAASSSAPADRNSPDIRAVMHYHVGRDYPSGVRLTGLQEEKEEEESPTVVDAAPSPIENGTSGVDAASTPTQETPWGAWTVVLAAGLAVRWRLRAGGA